MSWNIRRGFYTKETQVQLCLYQARAGVCFLLETDIPSIEASSLVTYAGYDVLLPIPGGNSSLTRIVALDVT